MLAEPGLSKNPYPMTSPLSLSSSITSVVCAVGFAVFPLQPDLSVTLCLPPDESLISQPSSLSFRNKSNIESIQLSEDFPVIRIIRLRSVVIAG